ncbi:hypothetical protein PHMEG_00023741 [Phytophthora megakarya]|uniref:Bzip transcription factor n=1 Tax=Phytophthora megakarya TaxID=4795 RepID=A0A225VHV6_9STRA|nr:hypothetical protein PHMEG_00023741 [Phytophthora megakarya]
MDFSTLHPPNNHLLRDDLVGGAVQCNRRANNATHSAAMETLHQQYCSPKGNNVPHTREDNVNNLESTSLPTDNKTSPINEVETLKNISLERLQRVAMKGASESPIEATNGNPNYKTIAELLELGEQIKRKRRQETQKRYRRKQEKFMIGLGNDVQKLRDEIEMLELHRRRMSRVVLAADGASWDAVVGYFRLRCHCLQLTRDQTHFIRKSMDSNVVYNNEFGIEAIVRNWRFLRWFGDVEEKLENVKKSATNLMVATTKTSVTITQQTLVNMFPHLVGDGDFQLGDKLLGQRLVMHGSTRFVWGYENERVTSVISQSDMLTPMLHLLGNWEDVAKVFEKAHISPDFQWRDI